MKLVNNIMNKFLLSLLLLSPLFLIGQEKKEFKPTINWNVRAQIWLRYSDLNEGSLINGELTKQFTDVSIRRLRIPISSQVTPKIYVYSILGGNNYNFKTKSFPLEVLDLYGEYTFHKSFEIGIGKSGWQGLSRWTIRSNKTLMGLDSPLFTLNTVEKNDDIGRLLGIWFKGQVGKIDYRLAFNTPIVVTSIPTGEVNFANNRPRTKTSSYVKYQFFEHESNKSAYQTGTYLQAKKVFNIGAGFQYQEKAMSDGDTQLASTNLYDMKHWAVDSFLNLPLTNDAAITAYLGYYDYDFGKDYIRNVGADNPSTGGGSDFNGAGVAYPMIGTGTTWYMQFGYAFKKSKFLNVPMVIQPNIAIQTSNWDALHEQMTVYDLTVNFLMNGQHGRKISLGYQHRPIFDATTKTQKDYKGMLVVQYQVSLK
ncbi:porin [Polaribacter litorisediminis]|uniref:porin n=1 Tax=Polaribacter litorisediminis TaxID=1908341 RepID=UPI001CBF79AC|nr:porin [Polaribacter litorisediminis]UAM97052.1 porin [Polaribacter litorisediminis]